MILTALTLLVASAQTEQIVVAVGANHGAVGEETLQFAEADAARVAQVFTELGTTQRERAYVLKAPTLRHLEHVLAEVRGRATELQQAGRDVMLVFFYAGHGDANSLHLGLESLALSQLETWLDAIPTHLRVSIVDACRTTGASRGMGVIAGPVVNVTQSVNGPHGVVSITSASEGEPAQESNQLGGAVFTHYLLSGLRGPADTDGDGAVTLHEAYAFAYARTLQRTAVSTGAIQHAALSVNLKGVGLTVLTRPERSTSRLTFAKDPGAHYFIYSLPSGNPAAEVPAREAQATMVALPAGRFLIQRRGTDGTGITEIDLPWGGARNLQPSDFESVSHFSMVRRGSAMPQRALQLRVGYRTAHSFAGAAGLAHGGELGVVYEFGWLRLGGALSFGIANVTLPQQIRSEYRLGARADIGTTFSAASYTLWLAGGPYIEPLWQRLRHRDEQRLSRAGITSQQTLWTTESGLVAVVGGALGLGGHVALFAEAQASVGFKSIIKPESNQVQAAPTLRGVLGATYAF